MPVGVIYWEAINYAPVLIVPIFQLKINFSP